MCAKGETQEDETSDSSRFSRKSRANYEICFTIHGYRERRMEKGASLGKEAVLADSGRAGEVSAGVGWVRTSTVLTVLPGFLSHGEPYNSAHQSGGSNCLPARPQGVRRLRRTLGYVARRRTTENEVGRQFQPPLGLCCEMGIEPIADRCGHLVKIFPPSELVIGAWQETQPLWTSQRITQSPALMEGDTFIPLTLDNQCGHGDSFSWPIGNLSEAVFVKIIPQTDAIRPSHDVRNRARGLPPCQLFRPEGQAKLFRKVHHRTFEGQTGDIATLSCREDGDEPSKA